MSEKVKKKRRLIASGSGLASLVALVGGGGVQASGGLIARHFLDALAVQPGRAWRLDPKGDLIEAIRDHIGFRCAASDSAGGR